jgi:peptidyl-tRNA hydrolase
MLHQKLRNTYDKLKDDNYQGNNKKQFACKKIYLSAMSDSERYFNKWRKINGESKITEKVTSLSKVFEYCDNIVRKNFLITDNFHTDNRLK